MATQSQPALPSSDEKNITISDGDRVLDESTAVSVAAARDAAKWARTLPDEEYEAAQRALRRKVSVPAASSMQR